MPEKILVAGKNIDINYNRTRVLVKGWEMSGYEVIVLNYQKKDKTTASKIKELSREAAFTFLPSFAHKSVSFVKKNSIAPVIFDPLISKFMTYVLDYKNYSKWSYEGIRTYFRDKLALKKADFVIFDTIQHQQYFLNKYHLDKGNTGVVYLGCNNHDFYKTKEEVHSGFVVGFVGAFIPLQGVMKILEAAKLLHTQEEISFEFIGEGHDLEEAKNFVLANQLSNVRFLNHIQYEKVNQYINQYDVCLGIFGDSIKTQVVVPNKVFNYASCGKTIITMDTPAIRECFTHKENIFLVDGSPESISQGILALKEDKEFREKLEKNVHELALKKFDELSIARSFLDQFYSFQKTTRLN